MSFSDEVPFPYNQLHDYLWNEIEGVRNDFASWVRSAGNRLTEKEKRDAEIYLEELKYPTHCYLIADFTASVYRRINREKKAA